MPPNQDVRRMNGSKPILAATLRDLRGCWKSLALTDLAYKVIALLVLTPLVGVLFSVMVAISGRSFLADQDVLFFFLGPVGWICFVLIGALSLGILAIEQVALLAIVAAQSQDRNLPVLDAMRFAATHAVPALRITTRVLAQVLLTAAPFLALAGVIYLALLTKYDINYYLSNKPPTFLIAAGLGGLILVSLLAVLIRLATGWFYALPILLFEGVSPANALCASRQRATGRRRKLLIWILVWTIGTGLVSTAATGLVAAFGRLVVPETPESLALLLFAIGGIVLLWSGVGLLCSLLSTTILATLLFHLYHQVRGEKSKALPLATRHRSKFRVPFWLTGGRMVAGAVMGVVIAMATGVLAMRGVRLQDQVEITAHRGASAVAPDNTLASIQKAIEAGADWVEVDVQETADGEVVVFHDSDFKKVAGSDLKIWDATRADIEQLDIGSWFAPEFRGERVPTLSQVLETCRGKIRVNIELKYYGHNDQLEQRVVDLIESHRMESEIVIMSLKSDGIRKIKSLRPNWKVGLLTAVKIGDLTRSDADFLAVSVNLANRRLIQAAHASSKQIHAWTVNDAVSMSIMMGRGVDNIITDKPALGKSVLKQRATLGVPERLLLEVAGILGVQRELGEP